MSLAVALRTGALIGTASAGSLGAVVGIIRGEPETFVKLALAGLITGVAIAAIGYFAGQAAAIGAAFALLASVRILVIADDVQKPLIAVAIAIFGASIGYAVGLIH